MKALNCLLICLTTLAFNPALGQQPPAIPAPNLIRDAMATPPDAPALTKFNLDFPGGTPKELVAAIQKVTGRPLNAIIPEEYGNVNLPPLKMSSVTIPKLFHALRLASVKIDSSGYAPFPQQTTTTTYGFRAEGNESDDSIWFFYADKPFPKPPGQNQACHFYSLAPYLERGFTVDDITTAIQTSWKMLGEKETPNISFHKETKLLIAVGEPSKLEIIDAVLKALESPKVSAPAQAPAKAKPAAEPKADQ
jgi:hypothetical protein